MNIANTPGNWVWPLVHRPAVLGVHKSSHFIYLFSIVQQALELQDNQIHGSKKQYFLNGVYRCLTSQIPA